MRTHRKILAGSGGTVRPLTGQPRAIDSGFGDDTGRRVIYGYSTFLAGLQWRRARPYITRQMDKAHAVGRHVARVFGAVGGGAWWRGFEYSPYAFVTEDGRHIEATPGYADDFYDLACAHRDRELKLHVTAGDLQYIMPDPQQRIDFARLHGQIAVAVGRETYALYEAVNEGRYNGVDTPREARRIAETFNAVCPGPLVATSTPVDQYVGSTEAQAAVRRAWAEGMSVMIMHGDRDQSHSTPYIFDEQYWEGNIRPWGLPLVQGEPRGPNVAGSPWQDSQPACNVPEQLFADAAVAAVTSGQLLNHFSGPGVGRGEEELDAVYGFAEIPGILAAALPDDIGGWPHITHGNHPEAPIGAAAFFGDDTPGAVNDRGPWRIDQAYNDDQVAAVAYGGAGDWNIVPHRALASWRIYGPFGLTDQGTGDLPPMNAEMGCRLICGRFA